MHPSLAAQLQAAFLEELEDHVRTLNEDLLTLEKEREGCDPERLNRLFRAAHSLKGAASALGIEPVAQACHWLEDCLSAAREGLMPEPEQFEDLFAVVDAVQQAGAIMATRESLPRKPLLPWLGPLPSAAAEEAAGPVAEAPPAGGSTEGDGARPEREVLRGAPLPAEGSFLRVPIQRLDALAAASSELLRARGRLQDTGSALRMLGEQSVRWQQHWHRVEAWLGRGQSAGTWTMPGHMVSALKESCGHFREIRKAVDRLSAQTAVNELLLESVITRLHGQVQDVRLQPFGDICQGLERAVRDLAHATMKKVELTLEGTEVEVDRGLLLALKEPILHIVRNSIDHGIEMPAERERQGKPATGRLVVSATVRGASFEVTITDDGRGLDTEAIAVRAAARGLPAPRNDYELVRLIFTPGFSTAARVTGLSGRGVGLDVVRSQVEGLHGHVEASFEKGKGTRFLLTLPLTVTTLRALLVRAGGHVYAVSSSSVERALEVRMADLLPLADPPVFVWGGRALPVARLVDVLGEKDRALRDEETVHALLMGAPPRQVLFLVDELLREQEITVQGMGPRVGHLRHLSGATLLADGRIVLILHAGDLLASALEEGASSGLKRASSTAVAARRLMVVDDSIATRMLEKSLLEAAGYDVVPAVDGADAWEKLQENPVELVVADVEMPRMNGLDLVRTIRGSARFRDLPVILVTSLSREDQKAAGLQAGANAYLVKSAFDQQHLLETIEQLI